MTTYAATRLRDKQRKAAGRARAKAALEGRADPILAADPELRQIAEERAKRRRTDLAAFDRLLDTKGQQR